MPQSAGRTPPSPLSEPGRRCWTVIHRNLERRTALPFQGRLFGIRKMSRRLVQVYPPNFQYPVVAHIRREFFHPIMCHYHLVESGGRVLLVVQHRHTDRSLEGWQPFAFALYHVDTYHRKLTPAGGLGDRALFLGKDRCLSVSAKNLHSISGNSINFSLPAYDPVVLRSLSNRTFKRTSTFTIIHDLKERIRPSVRPFTLADHLLKYCNHRELTRGFMFMFMFHEYYGIPTSWEKLQWKLIAQDSEVRVPCLTTEKMEGSLR